MRMTPMCNLSARRRWLTNPSMSPKPKPSGPLSRFTVKTSYMSRGPLLTGRATVHIEDVKHKHYG